MHQHSLSEVVNTVRKARLRGWEGGLNVQRGREKDRGEERERERETLQQ